MKKTLSLFALVLGLAAMSFGQTMLTMTTLSAAVTTSNATVVPLASATGVNAPSATDNTKATYLYVDRELMFVTGVSSTFISVVRGVEGTTASKHASGALVFVIPAYLSTAQGGVGFGGSPGMPAGACTRGNEIALPRINYVAGVISDCIGGQWVNGDSAQTTRAVVPVLQPAIGATLQTAIDTAGNAAGAATEQYCTQIQVPYSKYVTGLAVLNGTTVGTNKWITILYDGSGNLLANSATAGTLTAGASTYQQIAFTTPYYVVGPGTYFGCLQANGTTDTYRRVNTAANEGLNAGKLTGQTFGTIPNPITVPTTFTTALGPYFELY